MLPRVISYKMLPILIIILLTLAQNGLMVSKQQSLSHYGPNLISPPPQLSPFEMDVPEHLEALGSRLTVRLRLSPHSILLNSSGIPKEGINAGELYLQLGIYERNGAMAMLTQEKIKRTISTNWQEVNFDCGWIVKGGKYFVFLSYYPSNSEEEDFSSLSSEESSPAYGRDSESNPSDSSTFFLPTLRRNRTNTGSATTQSPANQYKSMNNKVDNNQTYSFYMRQSSGGGGGRQDDDEVPSYRPIAGGGGQLRVLAKKTINVKYPTILFEVPTRLETYTTAAPITFGLTRTICKPKLKLPSTVLTLTMCSIVAASSANENSGPSSSSNHFSSNNLEDNDDDEEEDDEVEQPNPLNKPISQIHQTLSSSGGAGAGGGSSVSTHKQQHYGEQPSHNNRDRHYRRYNPDHHSSQSAWPSTQTSPSKSTSRQDTSDSSEGSYEAQERFSCHRDVSSVFEEPLMALQTEGRVTTNVECQLWGRNATYTIQMRERNTRSVIAQSPLIKVEWSSQFSLELSKSSVLRCQGSIRVLVKHPQCILPGRDKVRVYGHETLPVPSLLAPSRVSYIGEQQIRKNNRLLSFRCNVFPPRFLRFCFQYINTAVDESVAVVIEKCIPTGPANTISDGGWSPWSKWSPCSVTCGSGGKRFRYRFCDSPPPSSGADYCQGKSIQDEPCDAGIPCPFTPGRRQPSAAGGVGPTGIGRRRGNEDTSFPETTGSSGEAASHDEYGRHGVGSRKYHSGGGRPSFMDLSVLNVSTTPGCECGCILYDLVPTKNYSLVIIISANQSSCADEDEEDHHNFRWILHAKNERDRVRLDIVGMDVQCVTMTFRDGNTTDSNLLEVITASQPSDPIQFEGLYEKELGQRSGPSSHHEEQQQQQHRHHQEQQPFYHYEDDEEFDEEEESEEDNEEEEGTPDTSEAEEEVVNDRDMDTKGSVSILRIESTGPSLSIGTTSDSSKNCSGQFIYFIAYYTTIPTPVAGVAERKEEEIIGYNFWTFLFLKIMVLVFIVIVVFSTFGGFVTKVYRKYRYKELKCFENDDEEGSLNDEGNPAPKNAQDNESRCTSITLMSFDYSYWRRLRLLRLKYFLLRPRPLDPVTTKIKSFPNTPTLPTKMREIASTSAGRNNNPSKACEARAGTTTQGNEPISKIRHTCDDLNPLLLNKPISLSENNLREKKAVLAVTENGYELRRTWNRKKKGTITSGENEIGKDGSAADVDMTTKLGTNSAEHGGSVSDMYGGDGNVSLTSTSVSISMSQSLNGSNSSNSIPTPTPTPTPVPPGGPNKKEANNSGRLVKGDIRSGGMKLLKEQENLKRRAGEKRVKMGGTTEVPHEDISSLTPRSLSSSENSHRGVLKKRPLIGGREKKRQMLKHGDSTASVSTVQSAHLSTTGDDDSSRVASRADLEDTDQDFEMDYYDYDVMNAGNIPGSYLGLEPAFVLWNSEVYPHSDEDAEDDNGEADGKSGKDEEESGQISVEMSKCLGDDTHNCMEDSAYGIEMSSSSSVGMFSGDTSPRKQLCFKETSLDTLKFADDDDDDLESYEECVEPIPGKIIKENDDARSGLLDKYNKA